MMEVVQHAIIGLGVGDVDIIVLLQPSAPFRSFESIQECIRALKCNDNFLDSCMTIVRVPDRYHPDQIVYDTHRFPVNRQDLERVYVRAGTVYAFYVGTIVRHGSIYGELCHRIEVPEEEALNLDEMADWYEAERRVKNRATKAAPSPSVQGQEQAQPAAL